MLTLVVVALRSLSINLVVVISSELQDVSPFSFSVCSSTATSAMVDCVVSRLSVSDAAPGVQGAIDHPEPVVNPPPAPAVVTRASSGT